MHITGVNGASYETETLYVSMIWYSTKYIKIHVKQPSRIGIGCVATCKTTHYVRVSVRVRACMLHRDPKVCIY